MSQNFGRFKDKRVVVTGAGAGIGLATAQRFVDEGAVVALVDLAPEAPEAAQAMVKAGAQWISADVTNADGLAKIQAFMDDGIDVLVNNAGVTRDGVNWKLDEAAWDLVLDVNLKAVFRLSQMAGKVMKARGQGGAILNAASVVAHTGNFGQANYVASKAGVIGLTKTMARELGRAKVRVNAIAPGFIRTDMTAKVPDAVIQSVSERTPLARLGNPDEIASVYAFLASDDASYITGAVFNVDGGYVS